MASWERGWGGSQSCIWEGTSGTNCQEEGQREGRLLPEVRGGPTEVDNCSK